MAFKNYIFTTTGAGTWTIPGDFDPATATITAIGGGAGGSRSGAGANNSRGGSGGGAYASSAASALSNFSTVLVPGATVFFNIGAGGTGATVNATNGTNGGNTWFNHTANSAPGATTAGVLAAGGTAATATSGGAGGGTSNSFGTTEFAGGSGGSGGSVNRGGGGAGGGAGRPAATGGTGGSAGAAAGAGGGGGGGDAGNGSSSTALGGSAGGAGGSNGSTQASSETAGTLGGGGGGGNGSSGNSGSGGAGGAGDNISLSGTTFVNGVSSGITALGSGGGGGGGGGSSNVTVGTGGNGGAGGLYGGGGGSGGGGQTTTGNGGDGGSGVLIITYDTLTTNRTLYWVGGSGTWDGSTSGDWAVTSGGSVEAGLVPGSTDSVVFDSNSGTGTVTIGAGATCKNLTISTANITFTGNQELIITGNISTSLISTFGHTGIITFTGGSAATISANSVTFNSTAVIIEKSVTLSAPATLFTSASVSITADVGSGSLAIGNNRLDCLSISVADGGTLTFGTGSVYVLSTAAITIIDISVFSTVTGTINFIIQNASSNSRTVSLGQKFTTSQVIKMVGGSGSGLTLPSGTNNITISGGNYSVGSIILNTPVSYSGTLTFASNVTVAGNITLASGMTIGPRANEISISAASTITTNGVTLANNLTISTPAATVTLADALTLGSTNTLTVTSGTLNSGGNNITCAALSSSNTNLRSLTFTSTTTVTLTGSGTVWDVSTTTNLSFNATNCTINLTDTTSTTKTFQSGGRSYGTVIVGSRTASLNSNGATFNFHGNGNYNTFYFAYTASTANPTLRFENGLNHTFSTLTISGYSTAITGNLTVSSFTTAAATLNISGNQYTFFTTFNYITVSGSPGASILYSENAGTGNTGNLLTYPSSLNENRYWVRGNGNWNDRGKWSMVSNGAPGAPIPSDTTGTGNGNVIIDANSGTSPVLTINAAGLGCESISASAACSIVANNDLQVDGNANFTNIAWSGTGTLIIDNSASGTFTPAGNTFQAVQINETGGGTTITLGGNLSVANSLVVNQSFNTASFNINCNTLRFGASSKSFVISNSIIDCRTSYTDISALSSLVSGGSTVKVGATLETVIPSTSRTFASGSKTFNIVELRNPDSFSTMEVSGEFTTSVLRIINDNTGASLFSVSLANNITIGNNGTLNIAGNSARSRIRLASDTFGTARSITYSGPGAPTVTVSDTDFMDITAATTAITGTRIGNLGGNTSVTATAAKTVYWNNNGGGSWDSNSWAATSGGAVAVTNFPLPQDTVVFNTTGLNAGSTITLTKPWHIPNIAGSTSVLRSFTLALYDRGALAYSTRTATIAVADLDINGSASQITMSRSGTDTSITCRGVSTIAGSAFTGTIILGNGTFDTTGTNVSSATITDSVSANDRFEVGNNSWGTVTVTGSFIARNISFNNTTATLNTTGAGLVLAVTTAQSTGSATAIFSTINLGSPVNITASPSIGKTFSVTTGATTFSSDLTVTSVLSNGSLNLNGTGVVTDVSGTGTLSGIYASSNTNIGLQVSSTSFSLTTRGTSGALTALATIGPLTIGQGTTHELTLGSNITCSSITNASLASINLGTYVLRGTSFTASGTGARTYTFGTGGKISLTGTGTVWDSSAGGTLTVIGTSNIELNNNTSTARTIILGTNTSRNLLNFNVISGTGLVNVSANGASAADFSIGSVNTTGFTGNFRIDWGDMNMAGNLTLGAGSQFTSFQSGYDLILNGSSTTQTITTNGVAIGFWSGSQQAFPVLNVNSSTTTVELAGALTAPSIIMTSGTFTTNNHNITLISASVSGATSRTLNMGSSTWTLTGTGTVWDASTVTGLTFNAGTSNIVLSNNTTTARTFAGGGLTYNKLTLGGNTGSNTTTIAGSNTFGELASTKTVAHTILFTTGTTTNIGLWSVNGSAGNVVTIGRSGAAATPILNYTGTGVVSANYLSISFSAATPASTWYATNSTDGGNNTGWTFGVPPSGNFFLLFYV